MASIGRNVQVTFIPQPYGIVGPQGIQGPAGPQGNTGPVGTFVRTFNGLTGDIIGVSAQGGTISGNLYVNNIVGKDNSSLTIYSETNDVQISGTPGLYLGGSTASLVINDTDNRIIAYNNNGVTYDTNFNINRTQNSNTVAFWVNHFTGKNIRLSNNHRIGIPTRYVDFETSSNGNLIINPSGGTATINALLGVSGISSGSLISNGALNIQSNFSTVAITALNSVSIAGTCASLVIDSENSRCRFYNTLGGTTDTVVNINRVQNQNLAALWINHFTGKNLRLSYNNISGPAARYVDFQTSGTGDLTITPSGGTATVVGNFFSNNPSYGVSVKGYGAVGNGIANDTIALQKALNSGHKTIYLPAGIYKVNSTISIPKDVSIIGDGPRSSIIDGNAGVCWGYQVSVLKTDVSGVCFAQLPNLVSGVSEGTSNLSFASDHGLTIGDMVWVTANTPWNLYLADYPPNKGEIRRIGQIVGTTGAVIHGTFYDSYGLSGLSLYKVWNYSNTSIKNIGVIGQGISGSYDIGIEARWLKDTSIENIIVTNCSSEGLNIGQCDNVAINNCYAEDMGGAQTGLDYGLIIYNSQNIFVNGGYYNAARHATTIGTVPTGFTLGDRYYPSLGIVNRNIIFNGISAVRTTDSTTALIGAVDTHLGSEYIKFTNCFVDGGFNVAGDKIIIDGCQIRGENGGAIYIGYMKGTNFTIQNNFVRTNYIPNTNTTGVFVNIGGQFDSLGVTTAHGGIINIVNNVFEYGNELERRVAGDSDRRMWLSLINRGYTGEDVDVNIEGNVIQSGKNYPQGSAHIGAGASAAGICQAMFNSINFSNNTCNNAGGIVIHGSNNIMANYVIFNGNKIYNSYDGPALYCRPIKKSIVCKNNTIDGTRTSGNEQPSGSVESAVVLSGQGATLLEWNGYTEQIQASENTILNGLQTSDNSVGTRVDLGIFHAKKAITQGNVAGTDTKSLNVSSNTNFVLNENITGSISGALAQIVGFRGTTLIGIDNFGFTGGDVITGSISGATTSIINSGAYPRGMTTNHSSSIISVFSNSGAGSTSWFGRNVTLSSEGLTFANGSDSGMAVIAI